MALRRCPGSLAFTQPKIELVRCPHCGGDAEIWSDEVEGPCLSCRRIVMRTQKPSCADWCKYARECLGDETYKKYQNAKSQLRKEALLLAAEERFGWGDGPRRRSRAILEYAEAMLKEQPAADPNVVIAAAVLSADIRRDPGTGEAIGTVTEDSCRAILCELGYPNGFVKQVCSMLFHAEEGVPAENPNSSVLLDAVLLADGGADPAGLRTEVGRRILAEERAHGGRAPGADTSRAGDSNVGKGV